MPLLSVLHTVGKDLSHLGQWIEDALKIAAPTLAVLEPQLTPIVNAVEMAITELEAAGAHTLNATTVQQVVSAVTTLEAIKPGFTALLGSKLAATPSVTK